MRLRRFEACPSHTFVPHVGGDGFPCTLKGDKMSISGGNCRVYTPVRNIGVDLHKQGQICSSQSSVLISGSILAFARFSFPFLCGKEGLLSQPKLTCILSFRRG